MSNVTTKVKDKKLTMRILIVNTSESTGGAAVAANRLMEALKNNGVKAKMLVVNKTSDQLTVVGLSHRSEERRVGKSVDLGGRRIIKKKKEHTKYHTTLVIQQ